MHDTITIGARVPPSLAKRVSQLAHLRSLTTGKNYTVSTLLREVVERFVREQEGR
jgi:hypothetical protein